MPSERSLPNLPSVLIRLALDDLEAVERDPRYVVWMGMWHQPISNGRFLNYFQTDRDVCAVCLAGAVMARSLGFSPDQDLTPSQVPSEVRSLHSLDYFRTGAVAEALEHLGFQLPPNQSKRVHIPDYDLYPDDFKAALRDLADRLAAEGL